MGIQGIGQFGSFQSNYRIQEIPRVNPEDKAVNTVEEKQDISQNLTPGTIDEEPQRERRSVFTDPNEISIGINKNNDFSYIGRDKDIQALDIQKAISDMKQDSILQEYQYFVGSARNIYQSEDGMVIPK